MQNFAVKYKHQIIIYQNNQNLMSITITYNITNFPSFYSVLSLVIISHSMTSYEQLVMYLFCFLEKITG